MHVCMQAYEHEGRSYVFLGVVEVAALVGFFLCKSGRHSSRWCCAAKRVARGSRRNEFGGCILPTSFLVRVPPSRLLSLSQR